MIKVYGIKNCDTMKKALKWLDSKDIEYDFHDYKKLEPDVTVLKNAIKNHSWDVVINRRGTTWRQLPDDIKNNMTETMAVKIAMENPSIIKRPLLVHDNEIHLGFSPIVYQEIFE